MRVLLIKPETVGIFCYTNQVEHEPLEMEYLKTNLVRLMDYISGKAGCPAYSENHMH